MLRVTGMELARGDRFPGFSAVPSGRLSGAEVEDRCPNARSAQLRATRSCSSSRSGSTLASQGSRLGESEETVPDPGTPRLSPGDPGLGPVNTGPRPLFSAAMGIPQKRPFQALLMRSGPCDEVPRSA